MTLENTMLSKRNQSQENTHYMIPFVEMDIQIAKPMEAEVRLLVAT